MTLSVAFHRDALGMREPRREDYPDGELTLAFIGYGDEAEGSVIDLTRNHGKCDYTHRTGSGHIALGVGDIYAACDPLASLGVKITRKPGPMLYTATNE